MSENTFRNFNPCKRKHKTIETIIYNGKYVDISVIRKRALSITAALAVLACIAVLFLF